MTRVACIGEAMIELSIAGPQAQVGVAGDTLNTAIYLKRCAPELEVDYITRVGTDPFSQRIRDFISSESIGTCHVAMVAGGTPGLYAITTDTAGERAFTYWRSTSAARGLFADGDFSAVDGYDLIYLSGISLAILPQTVRISLLDWIQGTGAPLAFDSNFRPQLWENTKIARDVVDRYWESARIALPSLDDEMALFGESASEVEARFARLGTHGALKRGASGPSSIGEHVDQDYPPASKVVDSTAAGDSFNSGYLAALLTGATQSEALMAGHRLAAQVVQHRGAIVPR
jgi:2-dehydro-3-deoxygluconokinase